jgi:hypothetical protein
MGIYYGANVGMAFLIRGTDNVPRKYVVFGQVPFLDKYMFGIQMPICQYISRDWKTKASEFMESNPDCHISDIAEASSTYGPGMFHTVLPRFPLNF